MRVLVVNESRLPGCPRQARLTGGASLTGQYTALPVKRQSIKSISLNLVNKAERRKDSIKGQEVKYCSVNFTRTGAVFMEKGPCEVPNRSFAKILLDNINDCK